MPEKREQTMTDEQIDAVRAYLEAQDALDNREYQGINGEDWGTLRRRRNLARDDLDKALDALPTPAPTMVDERGEAQLPLLNDDRLIAAAMAAADAPLDHIHIGRYLPKWRSFVRKLAEQEQSTTVEAEQFLDAGLADVQDEGGVATYYSRSAVLECIKAALEHVACDKVIAAQKRCDHIEVPGLHPATVDLVRRFSRALAEKLAGAEKKYGYSDGWTSSDWMDECRAKLIEHVAKGDPRDVAAYCAFLWHHGEKTELPPQKTALDYFIDDVEASGEHSVVRQVAERTGAAAQVRQKFARYEAAPRPTLQSLGGDAGVSEAQILEIGLRHFKRGQDTKLEMNFVAAVHEILSIALASVKRSRDTYFAERNSARDAYLHHRKESEVRGNALAALSLTSTEKSDGWLPIEQAPKDETEVLLARGERVTTGHWMEELEVTGSEYHSNGTYLGEFQTGEVRGGCWMSWDGGFTAEEPPTHYMPLPAAPKAAEKSGRSE